jgi:Conserved hypothetical protein (DUF2461)
MLTRRALSGVPTGGQVAAHFSPAFFTFFRSLKRHNTRAWFADNRNRYEAEVEGPMLQFIEDFSRRLRTTSRAYVADPRRTGGSMYRIYRDTRFSDDKTPLKTWVAARFPHEARKERESVPAFYLHVSPGECYGGGGVYHVDMPSLTRIRHAMVDEPKGHARARPRGLRSESPVHRGPQAQGSLLTHRIHRARRRVRRLPGSLRGELRAGGAPRRVPDEGAGAAVVSGESLTACGAVPHAGLFGVL